MRPFSKAKAYLRRAKARTVDALIKVMGDALRAVGRKTSPAGLPIAAIARPADGATQSYQEVKSGFGVSERSSLRHVAPTTGRMPDE